MFDEQSSVFADGLDSEQERRKKNAAERVKGKRFRDEAKTWEDHGFKSDFSPPVLGGEVPAECKGGVCGNQECMRDVPDYENTRINGQVFCNHTCYFAEVRRRRKVNMK
jgi:hypothetical protein